ncbi:MAG: hypothetical protein NC416_19400, partial [Eubacterium sp.]|nr:hypothetical protein [Eubacterium sp.]
NKDYKERMGNIMGGVILEMESDKIWDRAWNNAWNDAWNNAWNKADQYADSRSQILCVDNMVKKMNISLEKACEILDITVDDYHNAINLVKEIEEERKSRVGNS